MKLNNNNLLRQWTLRFFFERNTHSVIVNSKNKSKKNEDTVRISWQAKRDMRNDEIKKMIDSGKPLKGVTYEEFREYYRKYKVTDVLDTSRQGYIQALKGDNASLREKEWRTNPNYRVPVRLFSSPEVTADREAALEKLKRGEEIAEWETSLLNTFPNAYEGNLRENEARLEGDKARLQNNISSALLEAGIELSEDDELQFNVWGYEMTVTGTVSDDKLELINDIFAERAYGFQSIYHRSGHMDEAKAGGLSLVYLWSAEKFLKEAGGGSVFDIRKDGNGSFTGLPGDLEEFIKKNAIGKFGFGVDEKYKDREEDIKKALYMRETFNSVIETVKNGDYNRLKNMTCTLTYKNGVLSC